MPNIENNWQHALVSGSDHDSKLSWPVLLSGLALICCVSLVYLATRDLAITLILLSAMVFFGGFALLYIRSVATSVDADIIAPDWTVTAAAADHPEILIAITDRAGRLVCSNPQYSQLSNQPLAPANLPLDQGSSEILLEAARTAWRDGESEADGVRHANRQYEVYVSRAGRGEDHLLWRMQPVMQSSLIDDARQMLSGKPGLAAGRAGLMICVVGPEGRIRAANSGFSRRAAGDAAANVVGRDLGSFLRTDDKENLYFEREIGVRRPLRLVHVPLSDPHEPLPEDISQVPGMFLLLDRGDQMVDQGNAMEQIEIMLSLLPIGLAMVDRDGRFLFANASFTRVIGREDKDIPSYPGDLVVREDKSVLADTIRRFAVGRAQTGDLAIRLKDLPDDPVSLSLSGIRGLGDAAVLLSLRDNSEEAKLKRQVAQATKMQAIGQLAGGVAHDFNNVLTAIIGHCDLMLLRHSPGDSDYDDIQQIKNNSSRAASLTRQLLAFSRQQTLRPQIIQLPDIVSEVSHLLARLMGEGVKLEVRHDRNLGAIRADPGQLEQVIVNLAVNARDAMDGNGILSIETKNFSSDDIRQSNRDILPIADYSAIIVRDTGTGIPPELQAKIFEPFFTTKDVGKGTGLGLSTVYGIIKQSGGYVFVDSEPGAGTSFTIYFPVFDGPIDSSSEPATIKDDPPAQNDWGSGTILLVEDEDMVRAVAERALSRQGYTIITASDGEDGLEQFNAHNGLSGGIDLVISDVVMPVMDGPAMAKEIRGLNSEVPILFMSGYAEEQLRQSIDVDRMFFLPKPFSVAQICEMTGRALAQYSQNGTS
ncbi:ATP-binding protein [Parasphingorhabdus sp. DH2-15]|uniref:hybrid sensor histidine kinase/response regulator n=1 Tax=Parasphingorhabdus sp. DH2-15 TaxID=3444112 RepID=UPI003F685A73